MISIKINLFRLCAILLLSASFLVLPTCPVEAYDTYHYDFTYPDRNSFIAAGWDFVAVTPYGGARNTEQTSGAVVSYNQIAHPGVLRIPIDTGDLWGGQNNTRNSLFRNLPSSWTSIRLKLSFAPTQDYQQAGLLAYQDDDNYVQVTRMYGGGNNVTFAKEINGSANVIKSVNATATSNLHIRLDRNPLTEGITAYYSFNGTDWTSLGSITQSLANPRLAIVGGASPGGFPNADLEWAEIITDPAANPQTSLLSLFPKNLVFNTIEGMGDPPSQPVNVIHSGPITLNWNTTIGASWLTVTPVSGTTPGQFTVSVNASGLAPGVYTGAVIVNGPPAANSPATEKVTLIVNPNTNIPIRVSDWKDGKKGALSISVDDGNGSCFAELTRNGFKGTYLMNGTQPPSFYTSYYQSGMELGAHLTNHICADSGVVNFRYNEVEPNIQGICGNTPEPCAEVISLAWPCGYTNLQEQAVSSDYFLSARGYNYNQLENTTPSNFQDLKSFNSHEHAPYPPNDLKTVVDMAEQQGKWTNMVFHTACSDDGAIDYAATRDVWVAPIGTVVKYRMQADRFVLASYQELPDKITFSFNRLLIEPTPIRSFETAMKPDDQITLQVDVVDSLVIQSVRLNSVDHPYVIKTINGNKVLLISMVIDSTLQTVEISYQVPTIPTISLNSSALTFTTVEGTNPANRSVSLSNSGGGTLSWTAAADTTAPTWLTVSPASGTGNGNITVSVNSAGMIPGTYTKSITVSASGATNTPQIVSVTLTVTSNSRTISLVPVGLNFSSVEGTNPANQTISLSNSGGGAMSWTATADATAPAWLTVSPASGTGNGNLTVSVNNAGLTPGTYTKNITISASGATNTPQTASVTLTVNPSGTAHFDFTYPDRAGFMADGWDFLAVTPWGTRNTEQTTGAVVSYDQVGHSGILRIPADAGDLWAGWNNTRNTLLRNLPADWASIRLKLSFAPTQNYQQAGLLAYQDDDNYVQITRNYNDGNMVSFDREVNGNPNTLGTVSETATTDLHLRLDRDAATNVITAYYSVGGATWKSMGSVTQSLNNPRLAIVVGASPGGFPNADLSWAEIITSTILPSPTMVLSPSTLSFTTMEGTNPANQTISLSNSGGGTLSWTATADATGPAWLSVSPASGAGNGTLSLSVNSAGMTPGTYTKSITVSASGATNTPQTVNVTMTVNAAPAALSALALSPTSVSGGNISLGIVTLSSTAPISGAVVTLVSDNPMVVSVPASVTVPGGSTSAIFTANTSLVASSAVVVISADYGGVTRSAALAVSATSQSITITTPAPATAKYNTSFTVAATASSGLPVTYSSGSPSVCTNTGATFTMVSGTGVCTVQYNQAGNSSYAAAPQIAETTTAAKADQTITFGPLPNKPVGDADFGPGATSSSGLAISYASATPTVATIVVGNIHIVGAGTSVITASQAGDSNYNAAISAVQTLTVSTSSQSITITTPAPATAKYNTSFTVAATASSGLLVTYSSGSPSVCTNTGATFTMVSGTGACTVQYNQAGNSSYAAAPQIAETTTAAKADQTITFGPLPNKVAGDADFGPGATSSSGLAISYASTTPTVATIVGGNIHIVGAGTSVITASQAGDSNYNAAISAVQTLTVSTAPVVLSSLTRSPSSVVGGNTSQGTVTLSGQAPSGGVIVLLSSNDSSIAGVPTSVTIPSGSISAAFTITTNPVAGSTSVTISAIYGGVTMTAAVTVTPPTLSSLSRSPSNVVGGNNSQGTVTLSGRAPSGGVVVSLSSNNSSVAGVPTSVTIPSGSTSATFTITTNPVAGSTSVTISAIYGGVTRTATLTVTPPTLSSLSRSPSSVVGGNNSQGTVTLSGRAPSGGVVVSLSINNSSVAGVPTSVTIPSGTTSATFTITTNPVAGSTSVTISAIYGGVTRTTTLTVTAPTLSAVSLNPTSVVGGNTSMGTVTLSGPAPSGGIIVSLSDNSSSVGVPASVMVPSGGTSAVFTITTIAVTSSQSASISATYGGRTRSATLTITP